MSALVLSYDQAERFVAQQSRRGNSVHWDGWTMVFHDSRPQSREFALVNKKGARYNGVWGIATRIAPDANGNWKVPRKYVKP